MCTPAVTYWLIYLHAWHTTVKKDGHTKQISSIQISLLFRTFQRWIRFLLSMCYSKRFCWLEMDSDGKITLEVYVCNSLMLLITDELWCTVYLKAKMNFCVHHPLRRSCSQCIVKNVFCFFNLLQYWNMTSRFNFSLLLSVYSSSSSSGTVEHY
jgi:hypothetical protein